MPYRNRSDEEFQYKWNRRLCYGLIIYYFLLCPFIVWSWIFLSRSLQTTPYTVLYTAYHDTCIVNTTITYQNEYILNCGVYDNNNYTFPLCYDIKYNSSIIKTNPNTNMDDNLGKYLCYSTPIDNCTDENVVFDYTNLTKTFVDNNECNGGVYYYYKRLYQPYKWNSMCNDTNTNNTDRSLCLLTINRHISYHVNITPAKNKFDNLIWNSADFITDGNYKCYYDFYKLDLVLDDGYYVCQYNNYRFYWTFAWVMFGLIFLPFTIYFIGAILGFGICIYDLCKSRRQYNSI